MELRHLRYFCAVAEENSFTSAAHRLNVSQSGVSGQVRDLEGELGVTLLRRNQREVALTPEGAVFLREAQEILSRAERAVELVTRASQGQYGKLTIGLCGPATSSFLPRLIREFRRREPGVMLSLKDIEPAQQPAALANREIDIGFTRRIPAEFRKTLRSEIYFSEPVMVVLPRGHSLEGSHAVQLSQLSAERIILYAREAAPELFDSIIAMCKRAKFSPKIADTPRLWQTVLTMVEASEGIALVPACVQHLRSNGISFKPLPDKKCHVDVVLAWRQNDPDAIRDTLLNLLRKSRPNLERPSQEATA
ncbi:MAG TPA: LysR substrate-binding domain-containing protein [Candidatus Acidoferrum sp.]|nr:LysR substrate-binding domain-containing protein [Candidatus Acidoferrum sp.]